MTMRSLIVLSSLFLFTVFSQHVEAKLSNSEMNLQRAGDEKLEGTRALTADTDPDYVGMTAEVRFLLSLDMCAIFLRS